MESDSFLQTAVSRDHKTRLPPLFGEPDETKTEELGQKRTDRAAKTETKGQPGMKRVLFGHDSHLKSDNTFDLTILRATFSVFSFGTFWSGQSLGVGVGCSCSRQLQNGRKGNQ